MRTSFRANPAPLAGTERYPSAGGAAPLSGSGRPAGRSPVESLGRRLTIGRIGALAVAALLLALWLLVEPRTPDLAAAVYREGLFHELGLAVWDERWYSGHHLPGYSLLFPPLASLLGLRLLAVLSVLASTALFARIALAAYGPRARWGAALFALAAVADVWIGRVAFALGVSLALGAVFALMRGRLVLAGVLAALCATASPVAAALLALAGVTHAVSRRSLRALVSLSAPAGAVVLPLVLLFPEGGYEPYPIGSFAATMLVVAAFLWALPPAERLLRDGALIYLLACLLCLLVRSPMGSNIERYAVLLAGPLLVCALLCKAPAGGRSLRRLGRSGGGGPLDPRAAREHVGGRRLAPAAVLAVCICAVWVVWGPARETLAVAGSASDRASYYEPVKRFLAARAGLPTRVEVPLTRSHWEAALLAGTVSLARGWEKQLDERFDRVLLSPGLTAAAYRRWLSDQAVGYVALPDTPLDPSSAQEGRLIRGGLPYLREVSRSRHWRIYAVLSPTPLATGPGRLTALAHDSFALQAGLPGRFVVRVHYSRYLTLAAGRGCVGPAAGGWTSVLARAPGTVIVRARFSLSRALGLAGACRASGGPERAVARRP